MGISAPDFSDYRSAIGRDAKAALAEWHKVRELIWEFKALTEMVALDDGSA